MRLAFCFLSNNIEKISALDKNFHYNINHISNDVVVSYTKNLLTNPPVPEYFYPLKWNTQWRTYYTDQVADMFSLRQDSLAMAGNADVIFIGDDDFEFKEGSTKVINQCCHYMEDNRDCGAIYLGGNFGGEGNKHGDEIYIANSGHLSTNRGILVRNRPNIMDNRLHALGANFDFVIGFTCLMHGLYIARRLHVPIEHHTSNIIKKDHKNLFYDLDYLRTKGIMSKVNKVIGKWEDHSIWPENIFREYRQMSMVCGMIPRYDIYGNILEGERYESANEKRNGK
jgi:hypothetical protein